MDITVNQGFSEDFINKDNFNIASCCVCAEDHETEKCSFLINLTHIEDSKVLPWAQLTLPPNLEVATLSDGTKTVIATECFLKGTQFGPYQAEKFYSLNPFDNFPIKIFGDSENILPDCYLDSSNEEKCNWMCYISAANNFEEQNLICYQIKFDIFFSVIRNINPGEHLKVWYSAYYAKKIGSKVYAPKAMNIIEFNDSEKLQELIEKLPAKKLGAQEKESWCCKMCGQIESNVVKFARHLQKHYLKILKNLFTCNICNSGFGTEKALKTHRKLIHTVLTDHKPPELENININKQDLSKTDLIENCMPLSVDNFLSVNLSESDQLMVLDQLTNTGLYNDMNDADTLKAILCDDNTKASKIAQEKSIADFSLELVESNDIIPKLQAPYYCDICNKMFYNLNNLFIHLKKHTGEYTCFHCLMVFTRRENYLRHPCFATNTLKKFNCSYCTKIFFQKKNLKRHIERHLKKYPCNKCGRTYGSKQQQNDHNCSSIPVSQKKLYSCEQCDRKFMLNIYLKRHIKRCHTEKIKELANHHPVICEICAKIYQSPQALRIHKKQHLDPKFDCNMCDKKYYRVDLYNDHLLSHGTNNETCEICNKKFKTKKNLKAHMTIHSNSTKHPCEHCNKKFIKKSSLNQHQLQYHSENPEKCIECGQSFKNKFFLKKHQYSIHNSSTYKCSVCSKTFKKNYLLARHAEYHHSNNVYTCQYCSKTFKVFYLFRRHLIRKHPEFKDQWNNSDINDWNEKKDKIQQNREVLLSIPDMDKDLGKNVYILENGAIETTASIKATNNAENISKKTLCVRDNIEQVNLKQNSFIWESSAVENAEELFCLSDTNQIQSTKTKNTEMLLSISETESNSPKINEQIQIPVSETDQQITLGKNAYILEDGTIVQPQDQGNLMIYILKQEENT